MRWLSRRRASVQPAARSMCALLCGAADGCGADFTPRLSRPGAASAPDAAVMTRSVLARYMSSRVDPRFQLSSSEPGPAAASRLRGRNVPTCRARAGMKAASTYRRGRNSIICARRERNALQNTRDTRTAEVTLQIWQHGRTQRGAQRSIPVMPVQACPNSYVLGVCAGEAA